MKLIGGMTLNKKKFSIWIIGPSAAGKTTISKLLYEKLNENNLVLVDGDKVRTLYENNLGYDKASRSKNTYRYINLVNWLKFLKIDYMFVETLAIYQITNFGLKFNLAH